MRVGSRFVRCGFGGSRGWTLFALLALAISITACHHKSVSEDEPVSGQKTFASPAEAASALANAARGNDEQQMLAIFGPNSKSILFSADAAEDRTELANFAAAYDRMNRWRKLDNGELLFVGPSNTAFPVPLRQTRGEQWYFDTPAGATELQVRRIGRNELAIIDVIASLADAQEEYFTQTHDGATKQFARRFISDPGKENGLYWPALAGQPKSPVGPAIAFATEQGAKLQPNLHKPFHGYYFGILDTQGYYANGGLRDYIRGGIMNRGFGIIAWPAEYGISGTMTFIINRDRIIFQKDMGKTTKDQAPFMTAFNPDYSGWQRVEQ